MLVPVSIVYDQLNEVGRGRPRRARRQEAAGGHALAGPLRAQPARRPRQASTSASASRCRCATALAERRSATRSARSRSRSATRINRATPVTPISLVTLALLGADGRAVTLAEAQALVDPVRRLRRARAGCPATEDLDTTTGACSTSLVEHGVVERLRRRRRAGVPDRRRPRPRRGLLSQRRHPLVRQPRDRRAGARAPAATTSTPRCRRRSACATCSSSSSSSPSKRGVPATRCAPRRRCSTRVADDGSRRGAGRLGGHFADRVLRSFLEAYCGRRRPARRARRRARSTRDESSSECVGVGRQYHLQGRITSAEAISERAVQDRHQARRQPRADRGRRRRRRRGARPSSDELDDVHPPPRGSWPDDPAARHRPRRARAGAEPPPSSTSTAR